MATIAQAIYEIADSVKGSKVARKGNNIAAAIDALNDACAGSNQPRATSIYSALELLQPYIGKRGGSAVLIEKTVAENGLYTATDDNADGYSAVTVEVVPPVRSFYLAKNANSELDIFSKVYVSDFPATVSAEEVTGVPATVTISGPGGVGIEMEALRYDIEAGSLVTIDQLGGLSSRQYTVSFDYDDHDNLAWVYVEEDSLHYPVGAAIMDNDNPGFQMPDTDVIITGAWNEALS